MTVRRDMCLVLVRAILPVSFYDGTRAMWNVRQKMNHGGQVGVEFRRE